MPPLDITRLLLPTLAAWVLIGSTVSAQLPRGQIYSRPEIPSAEALRRLNLRLAWRAYVPTDGPKDALVRLEFNGKDLIVLTRSGTIQRMDAETGRVHWRTSVGKPYRMSPFVALNSRSVYVVANSKLVGLDRATGHQKWDFDLPSGITADPIVDEEQIYAPTATTRFHAFYLPFITGTESAEPGETTRRSAIYGMENEDRVARPQQTWSDLTGLQITFRPLQTFDTVFVLSPSGKGLGFNKVPQEGTKSTEIYSLSTEGRIRVAPGSYGDTAYIGSDDAALYAININTGKLRWRHTTGTPITRPPTATAKDVYVTSDREGLARIDRESGDAVWRIPRGRSFTESNMLADRFLAHNDRFVYASDSSNRLLVLDRKRGIRLSTLDTRAYRVPVVNELTDRLYLAAHDGLIVCLHDRDVVKPIRHRKALEDANSPLLKILNQKIDEPGGKEGTLREALEALSKKYKIRPVIATAAFKANGVDDVQDLKVTPPRTEAKPLKDHLERLLKQAKASYQVVDQAILIVPGKKE